MATRLDSKRAKALAEFRKNVSRTETYLDHDIVELQFEIEWEGHATESVDVERLAIQCGYDKRPHTIEDGFEYYSNSIVELSHVQKDLDLGNPIILVKGQVVDGHHRLYRAFLLGADTLPAYCL